MPRNKQHDVWEHYSSSATDRSVKCKHCEKVYKFANVSKMKRHLIKCFKCPSVIRNKLKEIPKYRPTMINLPLEHTQQEQGYSFIENLCTTSTEMSAEKKLYLNQLLSKAIFVTGCPLSIVEHPLWRRFFEELQPLYKLPSTKEILTAHLESIYDEMSKEIAEELKSTNNLHLQCDGWSIQRKEGIINLVIAKPEPVYVKALNILTKRPTCQYIAKEILEVMNVYGTHKFVTLIGDNSNNIKRAFQIVKETHSQVLPLICVAHTLNLLLEDCLKLEPIKAFVPIAVETIKAVKETQNMTALLARIVKENGSGETLKLPIKRRWGSYCTALKSLQSSKVALQTLAGHKNSSISEKTKSNLLDVSFWSMTESCIRLLQPITDVLFNLEANGMLITEVYMAFRVIKTTLTNLLLDITIFNDHQKQEIINAVRRTNDCIKPIHCAAYMLDPRSQGVDLEEEHEMDAMEFIHEVGQSLNIDIGVDLANYRSKQGLWSRSFIWKNVTDIDPVVWWSGLCNSKLLSRVAVRILTAPCTSAATNRSFSIQGTNSQKRKRLTTDRAEKIAFIAHNWNVKPLTLTSPINPEEMEVYDISTITAECVYDSDK